MSPTNYLVSSMLTPLLSSLILLSRPIYLWIFPFATLPSSSSLGLCTSLTLAHLRHLPEAPFLAYRCASEVLKATGSRSLLSRPRLRRLQPGLMHCRRLIAVIR